MKTSAPIWLFDAACILCSASVQHVLKHEREPSIRFVAIQSAEGRWLALAHGVDPDRPETFLWIEDGKALGKSDGVIALARRLKGPAQLIACARFIPRPLRDAAYLFIARNRYRLFGKRDTCIMPDAAVRARFILPESA